MWQPKVRIISFNIHLLKIQLKSILREKILSTQYLLLTLYSKFFCASFQVVTFSFKPLNHLVCYKGIIMTLPHTVLIFMPHLSALSAEPVRHQEDYQLEDSAIRLIGEFFIEPYFNQLHKQG